MTPFTNFAAYYYHAEYATSTRNPGTVLLVLLIVFLIAAVAYVIMAFLLSAIFKKTGVKTWAAWVPVYNEWKLLQLGGQWGGWAVLSLIPYVNFVAIVFLYIAQFRISRGFGKSDAFVLWAIFVPIVWYIWLAVDNSKWNPKLANFGLTSETTTTN